MKENQEERFAVIDIGSTKVVVLEASVDADSGQVHIHALGRSENRGVKQGQIVNMEATVQAIEKAREEAELMAGHKITSVTLSIGGEGVTCRDSKGMVAVSDKVVEVQDVASVLKVARAFPLPENTEILHVLPVAYTVDHQGHILAPQGMSGVRLEVDTKVVTAPKTAKVNAISCLERAGLTVDGVILQSMASAEAVVTPEEKELGVAVVDIGGGTCEIIVYNEGVVRFAGTLPVGGLNFTQDVAVGLKTPLRDAELLKLRYGTAMANMIDGEETVSREGLGDTKDKAVTRGALCQILEARAEETLSLILQQLNQWEVLTELGSGVVLTGGGSQLAGLVNLGEFTFEVPVRLGEPFCHSEIKEVSKNPAFSALLGMVQLCRQGDLSESRSKVHRGDMASRWQDIKMKIGKTFSI